MEWLSGFLDQIIAFFQWIWDFFAQGIYDFVRDGLVVATKASMYAALQTLILLIDVSYTAARELIDSLGVPQALNIIMVAAATRFCMRFVPFIGR
ncbi:Head virion protein G6P [Pseudomonas aeruginosa]|uniref:Head virion protein G6P n=1 Tax=Pseudomonas aeruginosa TaxID=287 RepID=UPI000F53885A|nr:Head virion protein G6P [Pseudomonas aeruginosa]RPM31357.1 Head virion protein G6P [Pseudomonas aeruginosa]